MLLRDNKLIIYVAFLLCFQSWLMSSQSLVFQETVQNSTLLSGQRYVVFIYHFTNKGSDVIKINKIELTCGCSSYEFDKQVIAPGEKGTINIKVDTLGNIGRREIGAAIETDEKCDPYTLRGIITKPKYMTVTPRMLRWQLGDEMKRKRFLVSLEILDKNQTPLHIKDVVVNHEYFDVLVEPIEAGKRYFVYVRPKQAIECADEIKVITDPEEPPEGLRVIVYVSEKRDKL